MAVVLVKLLVVAGLNVGTALVIVQQAAPVSVLLGVALSILPDVVGVLTVGCVLGAVASRRRRRAWLVAALFGIALSYYVVPVDRMLKIGVSTVAATAFGVLLLRVVSPRQAWARSPLSASIAVVGALAALAITTPTPWLPPEVLTLRTGPTNGYIAYVLRADENNLTVLRQAPRRPLIIPTSEVVRREYCDAPNMRAHRSLWQRLHAEEFSAKTISAFDECERASLTALYYVRSGARQDDDTWVGERASASESAVPVRSGDTIVLHLVVWNSGFRPIENVEVQQPAPEGAEPLNSETTWTIGRIAVGEGYHTAYKYRLVAKAGETPTVASGCAMSTDSTSCGYAYLRIT